MCCRKFLLVCMPNEITDSVIVNWLHLLPSCKGSRIYFSHVNLSNDHIWIITKICTHNIIHDFKINFLCSSKHKEYTFIKNYNLHTAIYICEHVYTNSLYIYIYITQTLYCPDKLVVIPSRLNHSPKQGQGWSVKHTNWQQPTHKEVADIGLLVAKFCKKNCYISQPYDKNREEEKENCILPVGLAKYMGFVKLGV